MNGKIKPDKKDNPIVGYDGTPPFKADLMIFWFFKMLFQLCIFWLIYFLSITTIRETYNNNFIAEISYTLLWLFISDILASVCAFIVKAIFLKKKHYIGTQKSHKYNMNRLIWQYLLYCIFRSIGYVFGITATLSVIFLSYVSIWYGFWAFLLAWMIISIISKTLAFFISAWITKSI
jgi:hypothetical protein